MDLRHAGRAVDEAELEPVLLRSYFGPERKERRPVRLDELPEDLILAVVAAEDAGFFEHAGLSPVGIIRAAVVNLTSGDVRQGGSTLTQQLVKNVYLTHERTVSRKMREAVLAVLVDLRYDKEEILEAYLNEIYFGAIDGINLMGVGAAAWVYLGKDVTRLDLAESATLAGLISSPGRFSPVRRPERARARRDHVLARLADLGWIDSERVEAARRRPLRTAPQPIGVIRAPYFTDRAAREVERRYGISQLVDRGYAVLTTLDWRDQRLAEEAVAWGIEALEEGWEKGRERGGPLQAALVSLDPESGGIRAYVGGRDYRRSEYDRAGVARRQAGSAFKPVVYAAALEAGAVTPATPLQDTPLTLAVDGREWTPRNSGGEYEGWVTTRQAIEKSLNVATVRVALDAGLSRVVDTARAMGIESPLAPVPAVALGAFEVTPVELATAYGTLASGGTRPAIHAVAGVLDHDGEPVPGEAIPAREAVLEPGVAHLVTSMLQGVLRRGTGAAALQMGLRDPLAGKTGTSNDRRDSWFAGYAPGRVAVVWVGYDTNDATRLSGARAGLPLWMRFMYAVRPPGGYAGFGSSDDVVRAFVDPLSGELATDECPRVVEEEFLAFNPPREICHLHRGFFAMPVSQPEGAEPAEKDRPGKIRRWLHRIFGDGEPKPASDDAI